MSEREAALRALSRWREQSSWARRDPNALDVAEVEAVGPTQAILTSLYEARGVRYQLTAAPSRPTHNEPGPDPWNVALTQPPDAPVGHEVITSISGTTVHMDCGMCSAMGEMTCPDCNGMGRIQRGRTSYTCPRCHGRGQMTCTQCRGSGGLLGAPSVWSRIERHEIVRVHESSDLPVDVFLDLAEGAQGGEVIHRQEAERIVDLKREGTYRDAASRDDPIRDIVRKLGEDPGVPRGGRIRRQRLEVRRVPAWRVALQGGKTLWVYGDPPKVSPPNALRSPKVIAAVAAPVLALIFAIASGVYILLR